MLAPGGQPEPLLLLAPLLLMLSQDPLLLRQLGERQRYLPPVLAVSAYLCVFAVVQVRRCWRRWRHAQLHAVPKARTSCIALTAR